MRSFQLPIELSGVTVSINGAACGLKSVSQQQIDFVAPIGLANSTAGTIYPLVINNQGTQIKGFVTLVPARPDIFNRATTLTPLGRAKLFNVVNTVHTTEPFAINTIMRKGNKLVPTVLRIYLTGVANAPSTAITVRIGNSTISTVNTSPVIVEPGIQTFDFTLPAGLYGAGDQPIIVTVTTADGVSFSSRLDDTTSRVSIL